MNDIITYLGKPKTQEAIHNIILHREHDLTWQKQSKIALQKRRKQKDHVIIRTQIPISTPRSLYRQRPVRPLAHGCTTLPHVDLKLVWHRLRSAFADGSKREVFGQLSSLLPGSRVTLI